MVILGLILASLIGITLGLVGSGGSILTVPVFVYLFGVEPSLATTYSLFAIGTTSALGALKSYANNELDTHKIVEFGLPSLIMVFVARQFILPYVPDIIQLGPWAIPKNLLLMLLFGFIMILAALSMIKNVKEGESILGNMKVTRGKTIWQGILIGSITGVIGAGGGFLIIPALMTFYKIPIKKAVATSLAIVALNSIFGLLGDLKKISRFDWEIVGSYTLFVTIGLFIGFYLSKYISNRQLKVGLGYLILFMGTFIILNELLNSSM